MKCGDMPRAPSWPETLDAEPQPNLAEAQALGAQLASSGEGRLFGGILEEATADDPEAERWDAAGGLAPGELRPQGGPRPLAADRGLELCNRIDELLQQHRLGAVARRRTLDDLELGARSPDDRAEPRCEGDVAGEPVAPDRDEDAGAELTDLGERGDKARTLFQR